MRVGIDISLMHEFSKSRGIGFYAENLYQAIKKYTDVEVTLIKDHTQRSGVDIIHYPYFDFFKNTLKIDKKIPTVVTIHDVTPLIFPKHYPPGIKGQINLFFQKKTLKDVKAIITDSNSSKKDISKILGVNESKIHTVYLAPAPHFKKIIDKNKLKKTASKFKLPDKFALFVGSVNWNKNLLNISKSCIDADIDLFCIGKDFEKKESLTHAELKSYAEFIDKYSNHPKIHLLGFVSDEDLVGIYNLANFLMLISFYEGFGLPILEAQKVCLPVITSNISSMSEIAGSGAILVDPYNIDSIKEAITKILSDKGLAADLINKGYKNVSKFSWQKASQESVEVYKKILTQ